MRRQAVRAIQPSTSSDGLFMHGPNVLPRMGTPQQSVSFFKGYPDVEANEFIQLGRIERIGLSVVQKVVRGRGYFSLMSCVTLFSFIIDDIRVLTLPPSADSAIDAFLFLLFAVFGLDIGLRVFVNPPYIRSLFFWFDVYGTVGLLMDIEAVHGRVSAECDSWFLHRLKLTIRSARLCTAAVRLIRQLNLTKVASHNVSSESQRDLQSSQTDLNIPDPPRIAKAASVITTFEEPSLRYSMEKPNGVKLPHVASDPIDKTMKQFGTLHKIWEEEAVSAKLQFKSPRSSKRLLVESRISKRVTSSLVSLVTLIGIAISICAWLSVSPCHDATSVHCSEYGLKLVHGAMDMPKFDDVLNEYVRSHGNAKSLTVLINLSIMGTSLWAADSEAVRLSARCLMSMDSIHAEFSIQNKLKVFALFDLGQSLLLCSLFLYVSVKTSADVRDMVLFPLERMIATVQLIWRNPWLFSRSAPVFRSHITVSEGCWKSNKEYAEGEIRLLENAFRKIGVMLGLVYGTAGSEMIRKSISYKGEFNPILPGKAVLAIFCFVKIGDFDASLHSLGSRIFSYINLLSRFIHYTAEGYLGSVNKNLGDSFLLIWKFPGEDGVTVNRKLILNPYSSAVKSTASLSILFAIKTLDKVQNSLALQRLRGKKEAGLTFGFHVGWAFEGPIGSAFKLEASYLSPNVNVAARVETAALQYDVPILLSYDMYIRLEEDIQPFLRHIDTVRLKGVQDDLMLYSFDLLPEGQRPAEVPSKHSVQKKRGKLKQAIEENIITVSQMFIKSESIALMRSKYTPDFFESYRAALNQYLTGRWQEAEFLLTTKCLPLLPQDGPTLSLLSFIQSCGGLPPSDWRGVRELCCK